MSGRNRASPVWSYYTRERGASVAVCNLCQVQVRTSNGGTTGLFFHLRRHHQIESLAEQPVGIEQVPLGTEAAAGDMALAEAEAVEAVVVVVGKLEKALNVQ